MDGKPEHGSAPDCAQKTLKESKREVLGIILNHIWDHKSGVVSDGYTGSRTIVKMGYVNEGGYVVDQALVISYTVPAMLYSVIDKVKELNASREYVYLTASIDQARGGLVIE